MTDNDLCESLQIDREQLEDWLELGLPSGQGARGRVFEPAEVHDWLVANGLAEASGEDDLCFATQQEAATWFGVSHDTLARGWRSRGMPGETALIRLARSVAGWRSVMGKARSASRRRSTPGGRPKRARSRPMHRYES
jgi:hypothetical protein